MRVIRATFLIILAAVVLVCGASLPAAAKDYRVTKVHIDATVRPDGSFAFLEKRTFKFDDDFTFAFYKVEKARTAGGGRVDITDFVVGEAGRPYRLGTQRELDDPRTPDSYWVSYDYEGDSVYGKWFYRADDEERTFDISYVVHDAVTVFDDFAMLYWKFIGDDWDKGVREVTGTIHLPPGADRDRVRAWLHTTLTSEYWIQDERTIGFRVDNLPARTFVEMRVLFPPELVPQSRTRGSGAIWDTVYAEESEWVEDANRRRERAQVAVENWRKRREAARVIGPLIAAIVLLIWGFIFSRFGREHDVTFDGDYYRELPSERPPAEVGYIMSSGYVGSGDMVATIMDLARRGYLRIEEIHHDDRGLLEKLGGLPEYDYMLEWLKRDVSELTDYESTLLVRLFSSKSSLDGRLSLHEFKKEAQKNSHEFLRWFRTWEARHEDGRAGGDPREAELEDGDHRHLRRDTRRAGRWSDVRAVAVYLGDPGVHRRHPRRHPLLAHQEEEPGGGPRVQEVEGAQALPPPLLHARRGADGIARALGALPRLRGHARRREGGPEAARALHPAARTGRGAPVRGGMVRRLTGQAERGRRRQHRWTLRGAHEHGGRRR